MKKSEAIKFMEGRIKEILLAGGEVIFNVKDVGDTRMYFPNVVTANMDDLTFGKCFTTVLSNIFNEMFDQGIKVYSTKMYDDKRNLVFIGFTCNKNEVNDMADKLNQISNITVINNLK